MSSLTVQTSPDTLLHARITRPETTQQKPLLVFLHYWGGSSSTWHKLTSHDSPTSLSNIYPTLAIDLPGWGQSTGPVRDDGSAYSISAMAQHIASLIEHLTKDGTNNDLLEHGFVLVGHSMGAKVTLGTLSVLPADLLQNLKGLALVAPAPPTAFELPPDMKADQQAAYNSKESIQWTIENVLANTENLTKEDIELVIKDSLQGNELAKIAWPKYGMQEDISHAVSKALESTIPKGLRAIVIAGKDDIVEQENRVNTEVVQFLASNGLQVTFAVANNVKHLIPLEDPAIIYKELSLF